MRIRQHVVPAKAGTHTPQQYRETAEYGSRASLTLARDDSGTMVLPQRNGRTPTRRPRPRLREDRLQRGPIRRSNIEKLRSMDPGPRSRSPGTTAAPKCPSCGAVIERQCVSIVMAGLAMAGTSPAMTIDPLVIDFDSINSLSVRPRPRVREDRLQLGSRATPLAAVVFLDSRLRGNERGWRGRATPAFC